MAQLMGKLIILPEGLKTRQSNICRKIVFRVIMEFSLDSVEYPVRAIQKLVYDIRHGADKEMLTDPRMRINYRYVDVGKIISRNRAWKDTQYNTIQYNTIQYSFIIPVGKFIWQEYEHGETSNVT